MDASGVATIVAASIAALAAIASAWYAQRAERTTRVSAAEERAVRFREPLLQAAFNLQSRLYNVVRKDFLRHFQDSRRPGDREYTVENTLYLLGQYFCWVEIVRRESQFLDPGSRQREQALANQLEDVRQAFAASDHPTPELQVFRGQQRAIGELMLEPTTAPHRDWPRWDCMGYADFVARVGSEPLNRWFEPLRLDLEGMRATPGAGQARLVAIQHELLELVQLLDPDASRTSGRIRTPL